MIIPLQMPKRDAVAPSESDFRKLLYYEDLIAACMLEPFCSEKKGTPYLSDTGLIDPVGHMPIFGKHLTRCTCIHVNMGAKKG